MIKKKRAVWEKDYERRLSVDMNKNISRLTFHKI